MQCKRVFQVLGTQGVRNATLAHKKENVIDQNYCRSESVSPKLNRFYESFIPNEMYLNLNKVFSEY